VVAPPGPGGAVRGGQQRVELRFGEEGDERPLEALWRDREDALDRGGVLGMTKRRVAEQRADCRQASVARPDAVCALALEVIEEGADQRRVEIVDLKRRGPLAGAFAANSSSRRMVSR
jgi:hypothetical protein